MLLRVSCAELPCAYPVCALACRPGKSSSLLSSPSCPLLLCYRQWVPPPDSALSHPDSPESGPRGDSVLCSLCNSPPSGSQLGYPHLPSPRPRGTTFQGECCVGAFQALGLLTWPFLRRPEVPPQVTLALPLCPGESCPYHPSHVPARWPGSAPPPGHPAEGWSGTLV